jgi:hypothetical protein
MPRTWALSFPNLASSASYEGSWFVQTGVQARGKNATTTGPFPRHMPSVTFLSRWLGRVKLGAFFPTFNFMHNLLENLRGISFLRMCLVFKMPRILTRFSERGNGFLVSDQAVLKCPDAPERQKLRSFEVRKFGESSRMWVVGD